MHRVPPAEPRGAASCARDSSICFSGLPGVVETAGDVADLFAGCGGGGAEPAAELVEEVGKPFCFVAGAEDPEVLMAGAVRREGGVGAGGEDVAVAASGPDFGGDAGLVGALVGVREK